jgi:hypothetical protein
VIRDIGSSMDWMSEPSGGLAKGQPSAVSLIETIRVMSSVMEAQRALIDMLVGLLERRSLVTEDEVDEALRTVRSARKHSGGA